MRSYYVISNLFLGSLWVVITAFMFAGLPFNDNVGMLLSGTVAYKCIESIVIGIFGMKD